MSATTEEQITELANAVLSDTDFFLVDMQIKGGKEPRISVFVDGSKRSVNLDECAEISNELGFLVDAHEIFSDSYRINVSSPGLDRPLVDKRQYAKNKGRKVAVMLNNDEQTTREGILREVDDEAIIMVKDDERFTIPFDKIVETKVIPSLK